MMLILMKSRDLCFYIPMNVVLRLEGAGQRPFQLGHDRLRIRRVLHPPEVDAAAPVQYDRVLPVVEFRHPEALGALRLGEAF